MIKQKPSMRIIFWGVRGSIPAPLTPNDVLKKMVALLEHIYNRNDGERLVVKSRTTFDRHVIESYLKQEVPMHMATTYGGNTSCVEVQTEQSPLIIIDAGTGLRALGYELAGRMQEGFNPLSNVNDTKNRIDMLISHVHWDHIQGFPFFVPAFFPNVVLQLYGKQNARKELAESLRGQQEFPNFPVEFDDLPCTLAFTDLRRLATPRIEVGNAMVQPQELSHPDGVFGYKIISAKGKTFVYASDTEHRNVFDPRLIKLADGADVLYYDAQYTPEDYPGKFDWGHSTYEWAVKTALAAGVKMVILGHHEPTYDDFKLHSIGEAAKRFANAELKQTENKGKQLEVIMAHEGLELEL